MNAEDRGTGRSGRLGEAVKRVVQDAGTDAMCCILMSIGIMLSFEQVFPFQSGVPVILFMELYSLFCWFC